MENLKKIAIDVRNELERVRTDLQLTFFEEEHIYHMLDLEGKLSNKFPSVSRVIGKFHEHFDSEGKSLQMAKGDVVKQRELLAEWKLAADLSTNMGSRVHFELEKYLIERNGNYKEVRQPIFNCDEDRIRRSDFMINAGKDFLSLMESRGAVLLDTEIVLGDNVDGYVGQGDNAWLIYDKQKSQIGIIITDYKTNQPKNFEKQWYTKKMYYPFNTLDNTALGHYYTQIPFYGRLLLRMLAKTKYSHMPFMGGIVVLLKDNGEFVEYRVPVDIKNTILSMDIKKYLK